MPQQTFIATAWANGQSSYGLRIPREVRDRVFRKNWKTVQLKFGRKSISIGISSSFWRNCLELRDSAIREWLQSLNLIPWKYGSPPKFKVTYLGDKKFKLTGRA